MDDWTKLPHDNRVEPGSVNIPPAVFPATTLPNGVDAARVAADVVAALNKAVAARDTKAVAALFDDGGDATWRDHLGLSWDLRTVRGRAAIAAFLDTAATAGRLDDLVFAVDTTAPHRAPAAAALDTRGQHPCVLVYATFASRVVGAGRAVLRVIFRPPGQQPATATTGAWGVYGLYTALDQIRGHEEHTGARRPVGASHGKGRSSRNWAEQRADAEAALVAGSGGSDSDDDDKDDAGPAVLIIGAGQGGLMSAARLKMLGVPTLVVDREARVGDNWRQRYRQLVLHDPVWIDHLPYVPFPPTWPVYTPKDKLADFFEAYVRLLELTVWTRAEVRSLRFDAARGRYDVTVVRSVAAGDIDPATGTPAAAAAEITRVFHPRHVIQATGHSGKKNMPAVPGLDAFRGQLCHSSEFPGATPAPADNADNTTKRRRAVVVGSCNSGHDIAQDLWENGYDVTMVQRTSTCVHSASAIADIALRGLFTEAAQSRLPCDDADLLMWSVPGAVQKTLQAETTDAMLAHDAPLLAGLTKAGFRLDRGPDGGGLYVKYFERGGGYYIDVGCSQLVIDGAIRVRSGHAIARVEPDAVVLASGERLPADTVVFATGYQNMRTQTRLLPGGDALADRAQDVWGFDAEGEIRTMWRRTGQPGFWFMGGNLALSRYFGRFLALQIKAQEAGLMPYA